MAMMLSAIIALQRKQMLLSVVMLVVKARPQLLRQLLGSGCPAAAGQPCQLWQEGPEQSHPGPVMLASPPRSAVQYACKGTHSCPSCCQLCLLSLQIACSFLGKLSFPSVVHMSVVPFVNKVPSVSTMIHSQLISQICLLPCKRLHLSMHA